MIMPDKNGKKWLILFPVLSLLLGVTAALQSCLYPRLGAPAGTCILLVIMTATTLGLALHFFGKARKEEADTRISGLDQQQLTQQMLQTQAQLASLQSQINPHFLYNTLESIRSKALIHDENEIADMVEASGPINPVNTTQIGALVSGEILKIYVDYNSEVKKGDLMAVIDQTQILASLEEAKASLSSAKESYASAKKAYDLAKLNYERYQTLYKKNYSFAF